MRKKKQCPSCGGIKTGTFNKTNSLEIPLGPTLFYKEKLLACSECDFVGSYNPVASDRVIEKLLKQGNKTCMINLLARLNLDRSDAYIERAFMLPVSCLKQWRKGKFTDTDIAFVRLISSMPWLVEHADNRFQTPHI